MQDEVGSGDGGGGNPAADAAAAGGMVSAAAIAGGSQGSIRNRNNSIKESAKLVLESIPQIPIHVSEIKKLIMKDSGSNGGGGGTLATAAATAAATMDAATLNGTAAASAGSAPGGGLDENQLLSVLTNGSTGRNPTFFKAYGHQDVFGLKAAIPEGAMEVNLAATSEAAAAVASLTNGGTTLVNGTGNGSEEGVLYVQLPEGHPVITGCEVDQLPDQKPVDPRPKELSIEEAIEQAEIIFDDGSSMADLAGNLAGNLADTATIATNQTMPTTNNHAPADGMESVVPAVDLASVVPAPSVVPATNSAVPAEVPAAPSGDEHAPKQTEPDSSKTPLVQSCTSEQKDNKPLLNHDNEKHMATIKANGKQQPTATLNGDDKQKSAATLNVIDKQQPVATLKQAASLKASEQVSKKSEVTNDKVTSEVAKKEKATKEESVKSDVVEVVDDEDDVIEIIDEVDSKSGQKSSSSKSNASSSHVHNLRPKRTLKHVHALKQQAKRRKRNANVAAGGATGATAAATGTSTTSTAAAVTSAVNPSSSSSSLSAPIQRVGKKQSSPVANGDILIKYKNGGDQSSNGDVIGGGGHRQLTSMKSVLQSIPGFSLSKVRKKGGSGGSGGGGGGSGKMSKLSAAASVQLAHEGFVDLESQDSVLGQVNLRALLNKNTFQKLPAEYQYKLSHLLPQVDRVKDQNYIRVVQSGLTNEFFAKACQDWKERLVKGDFTSDSLQKSKVEIERDRTLVDPWKIRNFEPIWGMKRDYSNHINGVSPDQQLELKAEKHRQKSRGTEGSASNGPEAAKAAAAVTPSSCDDQPPPEKRPKVCDISPTPSPLPLLTAETARIEEAMTQEGRQCGLAFLTKLPLKCLLFVPQDEILLS